MRAQISTTTTTDIARIERNGGVVTKLRSCEQFGNDGVGFIRVRKRKLKGSTSASFDLVKAVRLDGKPRHKFVRGFGSQKDTDDSWALCGVWDHAIGRMVKNGLAEDQRARLVAEMVRKGAQLPPSIECDKFVRFYSGHNWNRPGVSELIRWMRATEAASAPRPPPAPSPSHNATTQVQGGRS